jgi:hypothetical protein
MTREKGTAGKETGTLVEEKQIKRISIADMGQFAFLE